MKISTTLRNVLAVLAGIAIGSIVNMGIVTLSTHVIPLPAGADTSSMETLKASIHLFEPRHFIMPFAAHALGTLAGALVAALIAASHRMKLALTVGAFFLLGGIINVMMLPSPMWFTVADLTLAYIPMAIIGGKLAGRFDKKEK
jgi:hypothetical protein